MKSFLAVCLALSAFIVSAADKPVNPPGSITGEIVEIKDVEAYSYLRLKTRDGDIWAAVSKAPVKKGSSITIDKPMLMTNFESKALKQTFPVIYFGSLAGATGAPAMPATMAGSMPGAKAAPAVDEKVAKASGADARTVAEVFANAKALKDKPVVVRGKVVKVNSGIMGRNWVHLRDGSGDAAKATNDLLFTTSATVKVGDVVTAKGSVRVDKDFGAGYVYAVLVEDASFQ